MISRDIYIKQPRQMMTYFLVYALACWTYAAVDIWQSRGRVWSELKEIHPLGVDPPPRLFWTCGAVALAAAPLFMPFVMLEHLCVALGGGGEES